MLFELLFAAILVVLAILLVNRRHWKLALPSFLVLVAMIVLFLVILHNWDQTMRGLHREPGTQPATNPVARQ